jgi:hypothetical protein
MPEGPARARGLRHDRAAPPPQRQATTDTALAGLFVLMLPRPARPPPPQERHAADSLCAVRHTAAMTPRHLTAAVLLTLALTGCSTDDSQDTDMHVTSDDVDPWPFTVDAGDVQCHDVPGAVAVTFEHDGTVYAVNGPAKMWADDNDWADKAPIWADDEETGSKVFTVALERWAEERC